MIDQLSDEQRQLVDYVLSLRADQVRGLLINHGIASSGPKRTLRERLLTALAEDRLSSEAIAGYLDEVEPWGNQHIYLYDVADLLTEKWRDTESILQHLKGENLGTLLAEPLTLTLPSELTLAAVDVGTEAIEIRAVDARRYTERLPALDRKATVDGLVVEYRAYTERLSRGLLTLRWDLGSSHAALRISKAHRGYEYEEAERGFADLVAPWLSFKADFSRLDLRKPIQRLARAEREGTSPRTRSARLGLQTAGGREVDISSASVSTGAAGEKPVDEAVEAIAKVSRGRLGNFYWLPKAVYSSHGNPLDDEFHTMIVAADSRIHFMAPSSEEAINYVLRSIRSLC